MTGSDGLQNLAATRTAQGLITLFRDLNRRLLNTSKATGVTPRELAGAVSRRNYPDLVGHAYDRESIAIKLRKKMGAMSLLPKFVSRRELKARGAKTLDYLNTLFT